eukprot:TRINITY_DN3324_c0_g1_i1.p1 TRINITY_DN3324_c0_g1~~TRINITY_DN3324_c0_g1_i1.p1  ORF type:complete len:812 (-),score=174.28 TRINITY_DN3324_c0_g1_i1:36-2432(-)
MDFDNGEIVLDEMNEDFILDKVPDSLFTIQKLCEAIEKYLKSQGEDERQFLEVINRRWKEIKPEYKAIIDIDVTNLLSIRTARFMTRYCMMMMMNFFHFDEKSFDAVIILKSIANYYDGGYAKLIKDHPNLKEDLELLKVEGELSVQKKTALDTPHKDVILKKPSLRKLCANKTLKYFKNLFPPLEWLGDYKKNFAENIKGDLVAGLTIGILLVPQGIAYVMIAGGPPVYGLYCGIAPLLVYCLFGTGRQTAMGPTAVVSLIIKQSLSPYAIPGSMEYARYAITLSFFAGIFQLIVGLLRLGFIANFLSFSLLSGFSTAGGLLILMTQFKYIFGVHPDASTNFYVGVYNFFKVIHESNPASIGLAVITIMILAGLKLGKKKWHWLAFVPGPLIIVVMGIVLSVTLNFEEKGLIVLGSIPPGLPPAAVPPLLAKWTDFIAPGILVGLISFMESYSIGSKFAEEFGYELKPSQEFVALGLGNMVGSFFSAYPTGGSFSRTAVNAGAGARSTISGILSSIIVMIALSLFTKILYHLPVANLGGIVFVALVGIMDFDVAISYLKRDKQDFLIWTVTFLVTLSISVQTGIICGLLVALGIVLVRIAFPSIVDLGRLPGTNTYRSVKMFPNALVNPKICVVRINSPIYYLNCNNVLRYFKRMQTRYKEMPRVIVVDWGPVTMIDGSGAEMLRSMIEYFKNLKITVLHAQVKGQVSIYLKDSGLADICGTKNFFWELNDAVLLASKMINQDEKIDEHHQTHDVSEKDEKIEIDEENYEKAKNAGDYSPLVYHEHETTEKNKCVIF